MKLTPDDPKLTAYALGELDEAGRKAVETELEKSPECRREVEEIRRTATQLRDELALERLPELDFAQQRAVEAKLKPRAEKTEAVSWWKVFQIRPGFVGALAAIALLAVLAGMLLPALSKAKSRSPQLARLNQQRIHEQERVASKSEDQYQPVTPEKPQPSPQPQAAPKTDQSVTVTFNGSGTIVSPPRPAQGPTDVSANSVSPPSALPDGFAVRQGYVALESKPASGAVFAGSISEEYHQPVAGARVSGGGGKQAYDNSGVVENRFSVIGEERAGGIPSPHRYYRLEAGRQQNTATYPHLVENSFLTVLQNPLSTFSIDVDTASYANVRRFLNSRQLPPPDAVRVEEMINYFTYNYPPPRGDKPFSANVEVAGCPWNPEHRLVRIGLKGREIARDKRPPSNFVFLIDVSGSMQPPERLPLLKQALRQLVKKMTPSDRVAIVVYASQAGVRLNSTPCTQKEKILEAIDSLDAGGSTAGAAGIQSAYRVASENFIEGGVNRVLLCTDGDFNVGMTDQGQLVKLIQEKARSGVFLTTLGVGTDNYKDALMQKLADKGNGNYHYLDTLEEAQKVLIDQMSGTLVTIAKDVKIQIEFNPSQVGAYRLIGYEKRMLRKEDFNNDKKDAGEIGAGHTVTALYEIVPPGAEIRGPVDDLKYQQPAPEEKPERYVKTGSRELLTLKLRYKQPDGDQSRLLEFPVTDSGRSYGRASADFKFASAVASFGMILRDSEYKGTSSLDGVLELAEEGKGRDDSGYRAEFLQLVKQAKTIQTHSRR